MRIDEQALADALDLIAHDLTATLVDAAIATAVVVLVVQAAEAPCGCGPGGYQSACQQSPENGTRCGWPLRST